MNDATSAIAREQTRALATFFTLISEMRRVSLHFGDACRTLGSVFRGLSAHCSLPSIVQTQLEADVNGVREHAAVPMSLSRSFGRAGLSTAGPFPTGLSECVGVRSKQAAWSLGVAAVACQMLYNGPQKHSLELLVIQPTENPHEGLRPD